MKQQIDVLKRNSPNVQDEAANQQKTLISRHVSTEEIPENKPTKQQATVGVNTSYEMEQKQVKIIHDQYEESRLKENITFWKDKVDLLFKEKKESLNTQMAQHRLIRTYETQIEDLKA